MYANMTNNKKPDIMFSQNTYNVYLIYCVNDRKVSVLQILYTLERCYFHKGFKDISQIMFSIATYGYFLS